VQPAAGCVDGRGLFGATATPYLDRAFWDQYRYDGGIRRARYRDRFIFNLFCAYGADERLKLFLKGKPVREVTGLSVSEWGGPPMVEDRRPASLARVRASYGVPDFAPSFSPMFSAASAVRCFSSFCAVSVCMLTAENDRRNVKLEYLSASFYTRIRACSSAVRAGDS
jgi:hypothetical protein